nr:atp-dependent helicase fft2 [Quercus suber]
MSRLCGVLRVGGCAKREPERRLQHSDLFHLPEITFTSPLASCRAHETVHLHLCTNTNFTSGRHLTTPPSTSTMADSDPISEGASHKRRRLNNGSQVKAYDSQDDSGDELVEDDFTPATVATVPLPTQGKRLQYGTQQFHADLASSPIAHSTFPTQPLHHPEESQTQPHVTQPTQPLARQSPPTGVLVSRSSPITSPRRPSPPPTSRPSGKPSQFRGLLASSIGPMGTNFRPPLGVVPNATGSTVDLTSSDEELDPPVQHSSDEETQGLRSNIKPTNFRRAGRGLDSTPNRGDKVVRESPQQSSRPASGGNTFFSSLLGQFEHKPASNNPRPADDMISSYAGVSRKPRPRPQSASQRPQPANQAQASRAQYSTLDDVPDWTLRQKVIEVRNIMGRHTSIDRCVMALEKNKGNTNDAMAWLAESEDITFSDDQDELASMSPVAKRGVATSVASGSIRPQATARPVAKPTAKQQVKAPTVSIADKYRKDSHSVSQSNVGRASQSEDIKPRRRLQQGRKTQRSPSPRSSPPPQRPAVNQHLLQKRPVISIDDDEEDSDAEVKDEVEAEADSTDAETKVLQFMNECSISQLVDLCSGQETDVQYLLDRRPFSSLDVVRTISNAPDTKNGKKSRKIPIGEKIVETSLQMWVAFEAVDELNRHCEKIGEPIRQALKNWGANEKEGELQLMNLEEAHDSGIGTPASSVHADEPVSKKSKFLGQPSNMDADLIMKDYQLVGLNWLNLLWSQKISCILADDMGLGKTCQVIAFLAHLQQRNIDGVHLVIVPGSTLENWMREFARFAPSLNVRAYYGSQAERPELQVEIEDNFQEIDVIVTTYDMTKASDDNKFLRGLGPAVCVYDEAHALRNHTTDRYKQLMRIPADFKVLLTGTPLQNNLQELISILSFIMPSIFESKRDELDYIFKHKATTKDVDHAALLSQQRIARARTMMTPFILRRKKAQVLDLPTKHSRVEFCEMTPTQATHYAKTVAEAHQIFADKAAAQSKAKSAKASSNIMMALRKIAIQPLLSRLIYTDKKLDKIQNTLMKHDEFGGNREDQVRAYLTGEAAVSIKGGDYGVHRFCAERDYLHKFALKKEEWMDSGKVQKFKELVTGYAENGDRVLVFSQFTTMMDILEAVLETLGIKFMRLDGSTRMDLRQEMIDQFYRDHSIIVFMLSTKAGGAGINLACANKVIIFDSGFNPQDDIQAENRAHRVGQTRDVDVVRLVTRGTIEEQIHALGESKLALDERVAGEAASAADEKAAEKSGEQMVERMLLESLQQRQQQQQDEKPTTQGKEAGSRDLKDAFKAGMESSGVKVASKQAQF